MNYTKLIVVMGLSIAQLVMGCPLGCPPVVANPHPSPPGTSVRTRPSALASKRAKKARRVTNRSQGGTRAGCIIAKTTANQDLYALVPDNEEAYSMGVNPILWFYLPYNGTTTPLVARLKIESEGGRVPPYSKLISLSGTPGIVGIQLPQPLKPGISYRWFFTMVCDANTDGASLDGWIQAIKPGAGPNQRMLPLPQQLAWYKQEDIWHDRLTLLATQRHKIPQADVEWKAVLKEIRMEELGQERILAPVRIKTVGQ